VRLVDARSAARPRGRAAAAARRGRAGAFLDAHASDSSEGWTPWTVWERRAFGADALASRASWPPSRPATARSRRQWTGRAVARRGRAPGRRFGLVRPRPPAASRRSTASRSRSPVRRRCAAACATRPARRSVTSRARRRVAPHARGRASRTDAEGASRSSRPRPISSAPSPGRGPTVRSSQRTPGRPWRARRSSSSSPPTPPSEPPV
jgi:hypothetical protein